jgi:cell division protein FtsI (penicillin-binding protein 3)
MSGVVFHHIAEGIMAQNIKLSVVDARDSASVMVPSIKDGNILAADYVLSRLNVRTDDGWSGKFAEGAPIWGKGTENRGSVQLQKVKHYGNAHVPDVRGMGARDAVFMLESRGVRVRIEGRGKVTEQSLPPGHFIKKGETCLLKLR